jgi:signal transduction histidine kinase
MATDNQPLDIASQHHAEAPQAPLPGLMDSVCASLPIGLLVFDRDLGLITTNSVAQALLPVSTDLPASLSRLAVESGYQDWAAEIRDVLADNRSRRFDITARAAADQPEAYLSLTVTPLRSPASADLIGGLMLIQDETSRVTMERRLATSERLAAVGKLAARVAHELNNPLDGILRYANLAMRVSSTPSDSRLAQYLDKIKSGIARMSEILTTLLEFSRSTPGAFEQATVNRIVEDALAAMEGRAREHAVTFVCNFHQADMPVVRGSNLFQVFCNLVKNAIDAMPDGGTLTITTALAGPDVVICFEDTGVGLPEQIEKIFEPFFTTKESGQGTGLGLAVCKELIEKYAGSITAERRQPHGAAFTVRIPVRNCAAGDDGRALRRTPNRAGHVAADPRVGGRAPSPSGSEGP